MRIASIDVDRYKLINRLVYFFLFSILYDGIFRKWILVGLSTPIMMIKQVIAVLICLFGIHYFSRMTRWELSFFVIGIFVFITSLLFGHQSFIVAIYGCLPYWFGLPLCFIIGKVLNYDDLLKIGWIIVITSIINSLLLIVQFNLPISHILNYQGGEVDQELLGYSISSLQGGFRPSGLFVHNSQNALFQMLALVFILYLLFIRAVQPRRNLLIVALVLDLVSLPFSVSRTNIFYHVGILAFFFLFCLRKEQRTTIFKSIPLILIGLFLLSFIPSVNSAIDTIQARFIDANEDQFVGKSTLQGTLLDLYNRNIVYNVEAIIRPKTFDGESIPFWGYGQGMSTQVGGRILGIKENAGFALAEWDGLRIMCESGYIFGWSIIFIRMAYAFRYLFSINRFRRKHYYLSLILLPAFLVSFYLLNNWGNLFLANLSFLIGGLFLASTKIRIYNTNPFEKQPLHTENKEEKQPNDN